MENKCKIIDYIIFFNLLMKKKNLYFPNNFYIWWVSYLLPVVDYRLYKSIGNEKYYRKLDINSFITTYNIKYKLFKLLNNKYSIHDNIFCEIFFDKINFYRNNEYHRISQDNVNPILLIDYIIKITINFTVPIYFGVNKLIDNFIFEIPYSIKYSKNYTNTPINNIDIEKYNKYEKRKELNNFDNYNKNLFNNFYPIINVDYIFSNPIKKLIYLDLYKKVITR